MNSFSFDSLSPVQFEEFCYDLLGRLGAKELSWRKGTGLGASPSDQGRDIECYFIKDDPDSTQRKERWFVECKHYKEGVPPTKISGALTWALAERPDVLLLIASNAFSNPCKEHIQQFQQTNRPQFRIKVWELKELEGFTIGKPDLLRKYGLTDDFPFLKLLHPAHIMFLRSPPLNSLKYFFDLLEKAGPHRFREALTTVEMLVIKPDVKHPTDPHQTLRDLVITPVGYVPFRNKCFQLANVVAEPFLVQAIVNSALSWSFELGDATKLERVLSNNAHLVRVLEEERETKADEANELLNQIEEIKSQMNEIPKRIEESYNTYVAFCEEIVSPLFEEEIKYPPEVLDFAEKVTGKKFSNPKSQRKCF